MTHNHGQYSVALAALIYTEATEMDHGQHTGTIWLTNEFVCNAADALAAKQQALAAGAKRWPDALDIQAHAITQHTNYFVGGES